MGRARSENPRDVRLVVKLTAAEKAALDGQVERAGVSQSAWCRARLLGHVSGSDSPASSVAAKSEPAPRTAIWTNVGDYYCPEPLCQKRGAKGQPCPRHGGAMTVKA